MNEVQIDVDEVGAAALTLDDYVVVPEFFGQRTGLRVSHCFSSFFRFAKRKRTLRTRVDRPCKNPATGGRRLDPVAATKKLVPLTHDEESNTQPMRSIPGV
ncbi:hypothetical protein GCM10020360_11850 [Nonlabens tegetincola]